MSSALHTVATDRRGVIAGTRVRLRLITRGDIEALRTWKNDRRQFFFHTEEISPHDQLEWFQAYERRTEDHLFIVQHNDRDIGCMGFRLIDGHADVYNVLLGHPEAGGQGLMSEALRLLCVAANKSAARVSAKVLKQNPAISWYEKNEFVREADKDSYWEMVWKPKKQLSPIDR